MLKLADQAARLFRQDDTKDISLVVTTKKNTSNHHSRIVKVHSQMLFLRCPTMHDMIGKEEEGSSSKSCVIISGTTTSYYTVRAFVEYLYTDQLPEHFDVGEDGVDLLKFADRFGFVELKIHLEEEMEKWQVIFEWDACDYFLLADALSCALLKEYAMEFITTHFQQVLETPGWKNMSKCPELLQDLFLHAATVVARNKKSSCSGEQQDDNNSWDESVTSLRRRLHAQGKDIDGTREMLVKRLESSSK